MIELGLYDYIFFGMFAGFAAVDFLYKERKFPTSKFWKSRGIISMVVYFLVATYSPLFWDDFLGQYRLLDLTGWNFWAAAAVGFLLLELGIYAWHRTMHNTNFLWRFLHQTHHSAERVDIWGAFYFHPLDIIGLTFVGSFALVFIIGINPGPAILVNMFAAFLGMLQHANIKTPRWLGYIVIRPESHSLHHERNVHAFNYSDLPLWDMVFGTFNNPEIWEGEAGFYDGASEELGALLIGKNISGELGVTNNEKTV